MDHKPAETKQMSLPSSIGSKVDLGRLIREVDALEDFLSQSAIRQPGDQLKLPKSTRLMDEMITTNDLNLLREEERSDLKKFLLYVKSKSTIMHISFSADPTPAFTKKLVTWLRQNIHPYLLVDIGLQPMIGAGCIIRTTNKFFDFSLRQRLTKNRDILMETIRRETQKVNKADTSDEAPKPEEQAKPQEASA